MMMTPKTRCRCAAFTWLLAAANFLFAQPVAVHAGNFDVRPGFTIVDSIAQLREVMQRDDQKVRMKPGTYRVEDTWPDDAQSVFIVSGSNNHFDLRGVTIEVPTAIYRDMRGRVHSLAGYRIHGQRSTFEGATFENTGDHPPHRSLPEFSVRGDDNRFVGCRFIIRGSAPYGYGDYYGKGGGSAVRLQKHSAMSVGGDRTVIEDCHFRIHTFGHGISIHGAQDTVIRNVRLCGDVRPTNDIYHETSGPAARFEYKIMSPSWKKDEPIPRNQVVHVTEDGIRAYTRGSRDGQIRATGGITVEDCTVLRMRGGITLGLAGQPATVTGSRVIDCAHGYSVPSHSVVRDSAGNAAFGPLLIMPYSHKRGADIELELTPSEETRGDHPLTSITGRGHRIRITAAEDLEPATLRPIVIGRVPGGRYTPDNTSEEELRSRHRATNIVLRNLTPHPVHLTPYAHDGDIHSRGPITDRGERNQLQRLAEP